MYGVMVTIDPLHLALHEEALLTCGCLKSNRILKMG